MRSLGGKWLNLHLIGTFRILPARVYLLIRSKWSTAPKPWSKSKRFNKRFSFCQRKTRLTADVYRPFWNKRRIRQNRVTSWIVLRFCKVCNIGGVIIIAFLQQCALRSQDFAMYHRECIGF